MALMNNHYRFKEILKIANIQSNERILDLGSGRDIILDFLPKNLKLDYVSVDFLPERKNIKTILPDNSLRRFIYHNLETGLPKELKNQKFDVIFLLEFIEHIENYKTILKQCRDLLSINGRIVLTTPTNHRFIMGEDKTHFHCFRKSNFKNLASWLGMRIKIFGIYVKIPIIDVYIPSSQTLYNEEFLVLLKNI
jgi:2-polyprenyl-3-methyl-5-hydroxy-6-metoxy-1,4-benzoquinol methylase